MTELSESDRKFLSGVHFAVVSTIKSDGTPHQTPMWYELRENGRGVELLLNTPRGSLKHKHLQRNPRISVCVVDGYMYVTLSGTAELIEDAEQSKADYAHLGKRYRFTFLKMLPRMIPMLLKGGGRDRRPSDDRVSIRMTVDRVITAMQ